MMLCVCARVCVCVSVRACAATSHVLAVEMTITPGMLS